MDIVEPFLWEVVKIDTLYFKLVQLDCSISRLGWSKNSLFYMKKSEVFN